MSEGDSSLGQLAISNQPSFLTSPISSCYSDKPEYTSLSLVESKWPGWASPGDEDISVASAGTSGSIITYPTCPGTIIFTNLWYFSSSIFHVRPTTKSNMARHLCLCTHHPHFQFVIKDIDGQALPFPMKTLAARRLTSTLSWLPNFLQQ